MTESGLCEGARACVCASEACPLLESRPRVGVYDLCWSVKVNMLVYLIYIRVCEYLMEGSTYPSIHLRALDLSVLQALQK